MSTFRTAIIAVGLFIILLNGCANSSTHSSGADQSISVTVTDFSGNKMQDAAVILGDRGGTMKAFGTTDSNGQVTFTNAPADATITTATSMSSGGTATSYSLHIDYDVNGPLSVAVPFSPPPQLPTETVLGSATVRVTNTLSEATQNQILTIGRTIANTSTLISTQTFSVTSSDVRGDGKLSIIVLGKDANGKTVGYGALLGQTFSNMMTLDIVVDQPISYLQHEITNIPSLAKKLYSFLHLFLSGKGQIVFDDEISLSSAPSSTTINMPYIPGIGDTVLHGVTVYMDQDQDNVIDSHLRFSVHGTPGTTLSDQNFNFAMALTAPSHLGIAGSNTATPTLTWSGVDQGATAVIIGPFIRLDLDSTWSLSIGNLSKSRTAITLPELPDSLSAFRPTGIDSFNVSVSASESGIDKMSTGYYPKY